MALTRTQRQLGESLRQVREDRRLSVRTLAEQSGFSASFISQVENGLASPSISSLEKMAAALDVTLVELFQTGQSSMSTVVRSEQRPRLESGWSKADIEALADPHASRMEPVLIILRPEGTSGKRPHPLGRDQFAFILSGDAMIDLDGVEHQLTKGDSVTIPAEQPYRWVNQSSELVQILVVSCRAIPK
jgi:transcriptional regulator with XRE-family HTH domain